MNYTVHIQPSGYTFTVRDNETILAAALRQNYQFPYSCQQAICGICKGQLVEGQVYYEWPIYALTDIEREMGFALLCSAMPRSDLVIHIEGVVGPSAYPTRRLTCKVESVHDISDSILQVFLKQPEDPLAYSAGQYVEILHLDTSPKPYSIANSPNSKHIELHIRHLSHNPYTTQLVEEIRSKKQLKIFGPFGAMTYRHEPSYPLLLIAGGTGIAPFKAILEQVARDPHRQPIYLYWGAKHRSDLYWNDSIEKLLKTQSHFHYIPVLSQPKESDDWKGETGLVHEVVLKHHHNLVHYHVYASGPPEMVYAAQKAFLLKGLAKSRFYSDWLDYEPK